MENAALKISHERLVQLKLIDEKANQNQTRYFIYEIDDNRWQNVNPEGEPEYDLEQINQETASLPIGILTIDQENDSFSFEGDLTVSVEDQNMLFHSIQQL